MMTTGAVDTFPVQAAFSIELQIVIHVVCEFLCNLPVSITVGRLVTTISDRFFLTHSMLHRGILPSVRMLQLEIGIALEFAQLKTYAVMLSEVSIGTHTRGILQ